MAKTLTVSEEAYERLSSRKGPGESFSDVIKKLTGRASLLELVGVLSDKEAEDMRRDIKEGRKAMNARMERVSKRL